MEKLGIYIHIPFCMKKCEYCDFISFSCRENKVDDYIKALIKEIIAYSKKYANCYEINTIYIGGGTPSFIDAKYIVEIVKILKENWNIDENAEISIEVNPGTVDEDKLKSYYNVGINRLSIGIQSDDDNMLKILGRIHTYQEALKTYKLARKSGFKNINVDLMIGLPTQNLEDVSKMIENFLKLDPEHISVYSLILEDKTALKKKVENRELYLPSEEMERRMYWKVKQKLENAGFIHYEISNFAKKGYESKHNLNCWNQEEYLGFGLAAHSYMNNVRYSNINSLEEYINKDAIDNPIIHERQNKMDKMKEYMLLGLRKIEGVKISDFKTKFIDNPIFIFKEELNRLVSEELIEIDEDKIKLTDKGLDLANLVWEEFVL